MDDGAAVGTTRAVARSAAATLRLVFGGQLAMPRSLVGGRITFADGTTSTVFRETAARLPDAGEPAVLVVSFQLRGFGRSRILHAAFRRECVLHTPLFAGFPGFRSKLWLADTAAWTYRGLYEWDGAAPAEGYASQLMRILRPVCLPGAVAFHVTTGVGRDEALGRPGTALGAGATGGGAWWRPCSWAPPLTADVPRR